MSGVQVAIHVVGSASSCFWSKVQRLPITVGHNQYENKNHVEADANCQRMNSAC